MDAVNSIKWRRAQPGWYVAEITPNEMYVHVRREDDPKHGWYVARSDSAFAVARRDGYLSGGWRTRYDAMDMAEEDMQRWNRA